MISLAFLPSYLLMIKQSRGSTLFRRFYQYGKDGQLEDVLLDGRLSCANFVSTVLHRFMLIATPHLTVSGTEADMIKSGWQKTDQPVAGNVVVWTPIEEFGGQHPHIGFYLDENTAISNSSKEGMPVEHQLTFGKKEDGTPVREIKSFYTKPGFFT